jgi:hypothetical protein
MCSSLALGFVAKPNWDVYVCSECHEPVHVLSGNRFTPLRCPLVPCPGIPAPLEEIKASHQTHPYTAGLFQSLANREEVKAAACNTDTKTTNTMLQHMSEKEKMRIVAPLASEAPHRHARVPSVTETENSFETPEPVTMGRVLVALDRQAEDTPTRAPRVNALKQPRRTPPRLDLEYSAHNPEVQKSRPHLGLWKSPSRWFTKEPKEAREK